ncbi:Disease resistance-like protein CSA1 [Vitis vinifera]|uniref:Disease resistance-like protein CSA1 n=1 Tax=Vitis vinifera TaxID=29760 RepID=A0A438D7W5_VITVI|nr:Disease resistance-like protein CSA1 [Vitis vinifera]
MDWAIVREECPKDPSKWSRLWDPNDIYDAFSRQEGMKNIESISLDLSRSKHIWLTIEVFAKMKEAFAKMMKLRLLKLYYSDCDEYKMLFPKDFEFPPNLRYLHWEDILANLGHLRKLHLHESGIKELPSSIGYLELLEILDLSNCSEFEKFPEIQGNMKWLEELYLRNTAIKELPNSIGSLRALQKLYLENTSIKELPSTIGCLEVLKTLVLSRCSNFGKLPEIQRNMGSLCDLCLNQTAIKELPYYIELSSPIDRLKSLHWLELSNCENLETLPNNIELDLGGCNLEKGAIPSDLWCLSSLEFLDLEEIPELPSSLTMIGAHGCPRLETLSSPTHLLWSSLLNGLNHEFRILDAKDTTQTRSPAVELKFLFQDVVEYRSGLVIRVWGVK